MMPTGMIKLCGNSLVKPLKIIYTSIVNTGIFPSQWKRANVTPVHKKNDKQIIGNYRPISLLPVLSKVFEKIIFKHIYNHLISNNLISKHQSGFRPGDSCTNQLLSLINDIHCAFNDKNCLEVRSVYLDMSKAFDKVWHDGLVYKLKQNGIKGKLLSLLINYLNQRKQRVVINGQVSNWAPIRSGVPQGSVLGPLLFLIYINDLEKNLKCQVKFFADDTSLFSLVSDPVLTASRLNSDLDLISKWAYQWKMSFNPDPLKPAEEIVFSHKITKVVHPPLYFNGSLVKQVSSHKHLGLILDSKLSFAQHINEKIQKGRKWIGIIKHLRSYLPVKSLEQIYKMHVRPHFDYCDIIYHVPIIINDTTRIQSLNCQMNVLESTQYQAALAVTGAWKGSNTDKIYEELGWESLHHRRNFRRLSMYYKIVNNLTPDYLKAPLNVSANHYSLRNSQNFNLPICRINKYKNSFYPDALNLWNAMDPNVKNANSLSIFKSTFLKIIRPKKKPIFDILDPDGTRLLFQLRVGLSPLKAHKYSHKFIDTPSDTCNCTLGAETTLHFFIDCPLHRTHRSTLLNSINPLLIMNDLEDISNNDLVQLLLYGHDSLTYFENQLVIKATIKFIKDSNRFPT